MTRPPGRRGGGGRSPGRTGRTRKVKSSRGGDSTTGCGLILFALVASPTAAAVVWMVAR